MAASALLRNYLSSVDDAVQQTDAAFQSAKHHKHRAIKHYATLDSVVQAEGQRQGREYSEPQLPSSAQ